MNWIADIFKNRPTLAAGGKTGKVRLRAMRDSAQEGAAYFGSGAAVHQANIAALVVVFPAHVSPLHSAGAPASRPFEFEFVDQLLKAGGSREK